MYLSACFQFECNILSRVLVNVDGVWIGRLDLLTPYTHHAELHIITALLLICTLYSSPLHTHTPGFSVFTSHVLATDFNTGTTTVSLNYTLQISQYCSTYKVFSSQPDCQLSSLPFLLNHLRLPSQATPSILILTALDPCYIALGQPKQKTPFPNNSSVVIDVCLPCCFIETVVLLLLCPSLFPQEPVYQVVA
jgi:hypothetical protein